MGCTPSVIGFNFRMAAGRLEFCAGRDTGKLTSKTSRGRSEETICGSWPTSARDHRTQYTSAPRMTNHQAPGHVVAGRLCEEHHQHGARAGM